MTRAEHMQAFADLMKASRRYAEALACGAAPEGCWEWAEALRAAAEAFDSDEMRTRYLKAKAELGVPDDTDSGGWHDLAGNPVHSPASRIEAAGFDDGKQGE